MFSRILICLSLICQHATAFCWPPGTSPFIGPPKATRLPETDSVLIDWSNSFKDNEGCKEIDFMVMMHPRNKPSAYKISDFALKEQRSATLNIEPGQDYVFQVIARENKSGSFGIDYKFSDMITSYANGPSDTITTTARTSTAPPPSVQTQTTTVRTTKTRDTTTVPAFTTLPVATRLTTTAWFPTSEAPKLDLAQPITFTVETHDQGEYLVNSPGGAEANPWYIYECIPFLKDVDGFEENQKDNYNTVLVSFIRQMNRKPIDIVEEFLANHRNRFQEKLCQNETHDLQIHSKGYVVKCEADDKSLSQEVCCPSPWSTVCGDSSRSSVCFKEFKSCDGGRCVHESLVGDQWPDCLDGSDEKVGSSSSQGQPLPHQLVCVQCAGVVLSAGFICRESSRGLTMQCVNDVMGLDGACNACISQYLNIS